MLTLGQKLHYLRKKSGMSQQEVADLTKDYDLPKHEGVSQSVYCRYEADRKPEINPDHVALLAKAFDVDYEYLMVSVDPLAWYDDDLKEFLSQKETVPLIRELYYKHLEEKLQKMGKMMGK